VFLIGSSHKSQIRSVQEGVGRRHCAFLLRKRKLYLQDLQSGHPTRVNGLTMTPGARLRLQQGDTVALGPMEFVVDVHRKRTSPVAAPFAAPQFSPQPSHQPQPLVFAAPVRPVRPTPHRGLAGTIHRTAALVVLAFICMGIGWLIFHQQEGESSDKGKGTDAGSGEGKPSVLAAAADKGKTEPVPPRTSSPRVEDRKPPAETAKPPMSPMPPMPPMPPMKEEKQAPREAKAPMRQAKPSPNPPPKPTKPPENPAGPRVTFDEHVRPVFQAKCALCHSPAKKRGGLDLSTVAALLKGGDSGPAVVAGSLEKSLLWESIDTDRMPPLGKKVSEAEKKLIRDWILGARDGKLASR
jgi:predicted component of type VI protein secretion system